MTPLDHDKLAERAIDRYYDDDIVDENTLDEFIEYREYPDDWTKEDRLTQAIGDDIHDLLKNGNDEDLSWEEDEVEALRDGDYYDTLDKISRLIAQKLLARIYA